jgi:hypothetical protein
VVLLPNGCDDLPGEGITLRPQPGGQPAVLPQLVVLVVEVFDKGGDGFVPLRGVEQHVEGTLHHHPVEAVDLILVAGRYRQPRLGVGHDGVQVGVIDLDHRVQDTGDEQVEVEPLLRGDVLE